MQARRSARVEPAKVVDHVAVSALATTVTPAASSLRALPSSPEPTPALFANCRLDPRDVQANALAPFVVRPGHTGHAPELALKSDTLTVKLLEDVGLSCVRAGLMLEKHDYIVDSVSIS